MSCGGQLTLINIGLTSLPMFMFCFFQILKGVLKRLALVDPESSYVAFIPFLFFLLLLHQL